MFTRRNLMTVLAVLSVAAFNATAASPAAEERWDGTIVQHGKMHQAIGMQQHQGRVSLSQLVKRPHFYAVAALEGLGGEVTIHDSKVIITEVDSSGKLSVTSNPKSNQKATMLVGAYIPSWTDHSVDRDVAPKAFDQFVADTASATGIDTSKPFIFKMEGQFSDVHLHVINGACPIHARMKKDELPKEKAPFEAEYSTLRGTVVGVFAKDSVGNLTHPATLVHLHVLFKDPATGKQMTGHVERIGMLKGSVVSLPR